MQFRTSAVTIHFLLRAICLPSNWSTSLWCLVSLMLCEEWMSTSSNRHMRAAAVHKIRAWSIIPNLFSGYSLAPRDRNWLVFLERGIIRAQNWMHVDTWTFIAAALTGQKQTNHSAPFFMILEMHRPDDLAYQDCLFRSGRPKCGSDIEPT